RRPGWRPRLGRTANRAPRSTSRPTAGGSRARRGAVSYRSRYDEDARTWPDANRAFERSLSQGCVDRSLEDVETVRQQWLLDRERREQPDDVAVRAGAQHDHAAF